MSDKTSGWQGILESAAIVLAVAVASLAVAQAQSGLRDARHQPSAAMPRQDPVLMPTRRTCCCMTDPVEKVRSC
ncbi:hypothetical protein [Mesorhizobium sp. 113-3-9]|uniref:hypothetical protein n=1 Tax=Mesorhizobium sp. 113-3-9 TaxID=2744517 RepID=UPI0019266562|nr:hypothetical protein [Mesorhizobium sp. 113-3-9]